MNYDPTKFEDIITFLNQVNKTLYGVEPYSIGARDNN